MAVSDGQRVNAAVTNAAFVSRTQDSDTVGVVGLNNPSSGGNIANAQQAINDNAANITSNDSDIAALQVSKEDKINKGVANGYAELDGTGKVPLAQIPDKFASIEGNWDASTNTPTLADGSGNLGEIYVVSVAGTQDLGSGSQTFDVGDWVIYRSDNTWQKTINSTAVTSVNGETGAVSLSLDDITDVDLTTTPPTTDQALVYDGANWVPGDAGSGSGVGGISYVTNPDAETDASNHTLYDDGASATPVDGDGGSPTQLTLVRTTTLSEILRGTGSFKLSKAAADGQGEGVHVGIDAIDPRDEGQTLQVSFDYSTTANYVSGDLRVFVYDVDNTTLIGAVSNDDSGDLLAASSSGSFYGTFVATDSSNYRLLFHCTSTNALSWDVFYDNVKLGPIDSFVPVIYENSAVLDLSTDAAFTGGEVTVSRVGNVVTLITTADPTFSSSVNPFTAVGFLPDWARPGTGVAVFNVHKFASTVVQEVYTDSTGVFGLVFRDWAGALIAQTSADDITLSYVVEDVPSSNVVSNARLTQTTASVSAAGNGGTALTANVTDIDFTEVSDSHNSWDGTTFTAPKSNYYQVAGQVKFTAAGGNLALRSYINGIFDKVVAFNGTSSAAYPLSWRGYLNKGDSLSFRSDTAQTLSNSLTDHWLEVSSTPDFTNYGVVNPSTTAVEAVTTTNYVATTSTDTWDVPTTVFKLTLDEGTWDIDAVIVSSLVTTAGVVIPQYALSESTTPGTGLLGIAFGSVAQDGSSNSRRAFGVLNLKEYTVATTTDLYVHVRGLAVAGGSTISSFSFGTINGTDTRLTARRIK